MNEPQLEVVCPNCAEKVSPYVTECPYCGTRVRKRAPKLERRGDLLEARETVRRRIRTAARRRREARAGERPLVTLVLILAPAIVLVVQRAADISPLDLGAIAVSLDGEWWRLAAAPFVYTDIGYLFACGLAVSIFVPGLEQRLGWPGAALLVLACGALGMLSADAAASAGIDDTLLAAGGNGIALGALGAWTMLRVAEARRGADPADLVGVAVIAVALLLLPLAETTASPIAGLTGGLVGVACGWIASRAAARA